MIKVLVFIDWYLPAIKAGGPISSIANMVDLLFEEAEFYIITGNKDLNSKHNLEGVFCNKWQKVGFAKVMYLDNDSGEVLKFKNIVQNINPDVIYVNGVFSKYFSIIPCYLFSSSFPLIINPRGMFGEEALKIKKIKKYLFLKFANMFSFYKNVHWHVSNKKEYSHLSSNIKLNQSYTIAPNISRKIQFKKKSKLKGILRVCICGRLTKIKNIEFAINIFKKVDFKCEIKIIGFIEDQIYYKKLVNEAKILPENIDISFKGHLDYSDLDEEVLNSDLLISTSLNENYGHSIVEALAVGTPVLISEFCPWNRLSESNAGFRIPLKENLFLEKLKFFNEMKNEDYNKYNLGAREYFENHIYNNDLKNNYLQLLTSFN